MPDWARFSRALDSILDAVGLTPMVRLKRIPREEGIDAEILCKLEYFSPTGSLKDRIYLEMFRRAIERGELRPGMEVVEASTGNAGISCAWVGALLGFPVTIVMPEGMSVERRKLMEAYGARIVLVPGAESDVDLALQKAREIVESDPGRYWMPSQPLQPGQPGGPLQDDRAGDMGPDWRGAGRLRGRGRDGWHHNRRGEVPQGEGPLHQGVRGRAGGGPHPLPREVGLPQDRGDRGRVRAGQPRSLRGGRRDTGVVR